MEEINWDENALAVEVSRFTHRVHDAGGDRRLLGVAVSLLDLTSLRGDETGEKIAALCAQALYPAPRLGPVAAVCIYPRFVRVARGLLEGTGVNVAAVAGGFPDGAIAAAKKREEVRYALDEGAEEIDMVMDPRPLFAGDYEAVAEEVRDIKSLCGERSLKVILETGLLRDAKLIYHASWMALAGGADFIKTSTGKTQTGATPESVYTMLRAIREFYDKTGIKRGIKPSGGVSGAGQALLYLSMTSGVLGDDWLQPSLFRFGASGLAGELAAALRVITGDDA